MNLLPLDFSALIFEGKPIRGVSSGYPCPNCGTILYQITLPDEIVWVELGPGADDPAIAYRRHGRLGTRGCLWPHPGAFS